MRDHTCNVALGIPHQVGHGIGVKQEAKHGAQRFTSSTGRSLAAGSANVSEIGSSVASTTSRPCFATGSIINRSPSRRMIASFPTSSNSRGMRMAWFRPFRKRRTCRSRGICVVSTYGRRSYFNRWHMLEHMPFLSTAQGLGRRLPDEAIESMAPRSYARRAVGQTHPDRLYGKCAFSLGERRRLWKRCRGAQ
jgi:hypothetical protein